MGQEGRHAGSSPRQCTCIARSSVHDGRRPAADVLPTEVRQREQANGTEGTCPAAGTRAAANPGIPALRK
ncbi:hypothetical protein A0H81_09309 [Grifola frondosa]|uniref:Uncharacterized protein n=1 Tax=Grifola frondosa TaxID=5627 RepID=A0A1C7M7F3_GRIFR|nr:hypothetical protein A0H81_09309 [Grifola frondosa]